VRPKVVNDNLEVVVKGFMSILNRFADGAFVSIFLRKLSFFIHVSASDHLYAKVVP